MLDDAALALDEIQPNDKTRTEVLGARVNLYMAVRKWDMAAAVASHLVKVERDLVDQSGLFSSTVRACIKGGSHSVSGASDRTQSCHVAFNLFCERHGPPGEAKEQVESGRREAYSRTSCITASTFLLPAPRPFRKLELTDGFMTEKEYEALMRHLKRHTRFYRGPRSVMRRTPS
jgi:hypothetical protein